MDISIFKSLKPLRILKQELLFKLNGWTVVSLLVGLFIFFPIGEILLSINSQSSNWSHLKETVLFTYFLNSFILVFGTAFISLIFGVSSAWLISNYQFKYGKILEWDGHVKRLERSLKELDMKFDISETELLDIHFDLIKKNALKEGLIYLQVTRGEDTYIYYIQYTS